MASTVTTYYQILFYNLILILVLFLETLDCLEIPADLKCLDAHRPLLDENLRLFSCDRGCPDTFYCENQHCCPNTTAISQQLSFPSSTSGLRGKKNIQFQLESSAEFERTMSCERFPYKLSCSNTTSQPLAKWYFDLQTLSCEMYPFGMCEDDPLDKLALRTKEECEERCDVAKVKEALGETLEKLNQNSLSNENIEREAPNVLAVVPGASQIAIDDVIQESKHIRSRPFAIEPPTDLVHVIHVKSDNKFQEKPSDKLIEIDENQLLTTTVDEEVTVPTVTSDILEILEDANDGIVEGSGENLRSSKISGDSKNSGEESEFVEESGESEENLNQNKITVKFERQQRSEGDEKSVKSMEDSFERFYQRNKESVSCSASPYRLLCATGSPTQFVYRWEKVGGVCRSFPYGYCWKEQNVAHPRTRAECEQFC